MSYISDLINNVQQAGIDPAIDAGCAVRRGWDYWEPLRRGGDRSAPFASSRAIMNATTKPDTDGTGMARIAHRHLLDDSQLPPNMLPILDVGMTVQELLAGIWRQSLVRPSDAGDPIGDNPYLVSNCHGICPSSRYLMTLIGHPPRDLALWFDELRRHDRIDFGRVAALVGNRITQTRKVNQRSLPKDVVTDHARGIPREVQGLFVLDKLRQPCAQCRAVHMVFIRLAHKVLCQYTRSVGECVVCTRADGVDGGAGVVKIDGGVGEGFAVGCHGGCG